MTTMYLWHIQGTEAWQALGPWIEKNTPRFGPGIKERFAGASQLTAEQVR